MENTLGTSLKRFKEFFSTKKEKREEKEIVKSVEETIIQYEEEKQVIKSLFDNDVIELDEYIEKLKIIDDMTGEVKKKEVKKKVVKQDYADVIIRNEKGHILFLRRNSSDEFWPDCWSLPGGKIEENETPEEASKRETLEETNICLGGCELIAKKKIEGGAIHYYNGYRKESANEIIILDNKEHYSYQYISTDDYDKFNFIADLKDTLNEIFNQKPLELRSPIIIKAEKEETIQIEVEKDHKVGIQVPKGGSACSNCKYLFDDDKCTNDLWIKWNKGDNTIPVPVDEYCCDHWEE